MPHVNDRKEWIILDRLADIVLQNVDGAIVDIGMGMSTVVLAEYAEKYDRNHYSCDISKRVINRYGGILHDKHDIFLGTSIDFIKSIDYPIALGFIDGEHKAKTVNIEIGVILLNMNFGGILFIHDTYPPKHLVRDNGTKCGDIYKVRQRLEMNPDLWTFTWPYENQAQSCGLTMIMKKDFDAPYCRK